jgi:outer membrane protein TolC
MTPKLLLLALSFTCFSLTEEELVQYSLKNSYQISRFIIDARSAGLEAKAREKDNGMGVTASAGLDYSKNLNQADSTLFSGRDSLTTSAGVSVEKPLLTGGRIALGAGLNNTPEKYLSAEFSQPLLKGAFSGSLSGYNEKRAALLYVVAKKENLYYILSHLADLRASFWQAYLKQETAKILANADSIARLTYGQSKLRFDVGDASAIDTLESLLNMNNVSTDRLVADNNAKQEVRRLMEFSNLEKVDSLVTGPLDYPENPDIEAEIRLAALGNPELAKEEELLRTFTLDERFRSNWRLPRLDFSALYASQGKNNPAQTGGYLIGLDFSYRLFNNSDGEEYRKAKLSVERQKLSVSEKRKSVEVSLREIGDDLALQRRTLGNARQNAQVAELKNGIATAMYRQGEIDIVEKMKAENDLVNARLKLLASQIDIMMLCVRLELLTGGMKDKYRIGLFSGTKE